MSRTDENVEYIAETLGLRTDPHGMEVFEAIFQILWFLILAVVTVLIVWPFRLIRWLVRPRPAPRHRAAPREEPDVWRKGY